MDFIKETVLEKLEKHGYRLKQKGLDPEMGGPSKELQDFCKTVYCSEYTPPSMADKLCKCVREGNTIYTMLSGAKIGYGDKSPCYLYRIEQSAPLQEGYYWREWQSCTWESEYTWSGEMKPKYTLHAEREKGWWHEESINIGEQSRRIAGQEYVPSRVPGLSEPKYPSYYDDRVKIKYPYSRRNLRNELGGTPHDFAFLWDLMLYKGEDFAMKVMKAQEAVALHNKEAKWKELKKEAKELIQQGENGKLKAQNLIRNYLATKGQRS